MFGKVNFINYFDFCISFAVLIIDKNTSTFNDAPPIKPPFHHQVQK